MAKCITRNGNYCTENGKPALQGHDRALMRNSNHLLLLIDATRRKKRVIGPEHLLQVFWQLLHFASSEEFEWI